MCFPAFTWKCVNENQRKIEHTVSSERLNVWILCVVFSLAMCPSEARGRRNSVFAVFEWINVLSRVCASKSYCQGSITGSVFLLGVIVCKSLPIPCGLSWASSLQSPTVSSVLFAELFSLHNFLLGINGLVFFFRFSNFGLKRKLQVRKPPCSLQRWPFSFAIANASFRLWARHFPHNLSLPEDFSLGAPSNGLFFIELKSKL